MADLEKIKEETKKTIRSLLLSCKDGQPLRLLERDHMEIMGMPIPYKKLGYPNSAQMLAQIPDVCRKAFNKQGEEVYKAVADESTAHIANMVSKQRSKKVKKTSKFRPLPSRRPHTTGYSYRPSGKYMPAPSSYSKPRPQNRGSYSSFGSRGDRYSGGASSSSGSSWPGSRYTSSSAGMNVHGSRHSTNNYSAAYRNHSSAQNPPQPVSLTVSIKTFAHKVFSSSGLLQPPDKKDPNRKQTEEEVKSNIASLIASNSSGVWYHMLPDMYLGFYNLNLPKEYLDCVLDWTDILTHEIMHGKPILYPATAESRAAANAAKSKVTATNGSAAGANGSSGHYSDFRNEGIPSPNQFHTGQQCAVYISHVPAVMSKFYVQIETSVIQVLMDELTQHYNNDEPLEIYREVPDHCVCVVKDAEFQAWTRAYVSRTDNKSKAELFYVDFGNSETLPITELQPLTSYFTNVAAQAVPVTLFNVESENETLLATEFKSMTSGKRLILLCQSIIDGLCSVVLYDAEDTSISINKKLVNLGLAQWDNPRQKLLEPKPSSTQEISSSSDKPGANNQSQSNQSNQQNTPSSSTPAPLKIDLTKTDSMNSLHSITSSSTVSGPAEPNTPAGEDYWTVMVTHVASPHEVYLRIESETSAAFNEFMEEVEQIYAAEKPMCLLVMDDVYLAQVFDEDGPGWYRVRAKELLNRNTVECELVDYGSTAAVDRKNMYTLMTKYRKIPIQTVLCSLWGLDQVTEDTAGAIEKLVDMTSGKTLIAQHIDNEHGTPQVVLFDTSGEDDVEINSEIGKLLTDSNLTAHLPEVGKTADVLLTYIERDGTCFVQLVGPGLEKLDDLMNGINDYYTKQKTTAQDFVTSPQIGDSVCAKYEGMWYRATIQSTNTAEKKVTVYYGDYGNTSTVPMSHLRKVPSDVDHAQTLPMQALECRFSGLDDWNDEVGAEAAMLINSEEHFVLMTVKEPTESCPAKVQLTQNNVSINNTLLRVYEESLSQSSGRTTPIGNTSIPQVAMERHNTVISTSTPTATPNTTQHEQASDATDKNRGTVSPSTPPGSPPSENVTSDLSAINPIDKMTKLMMSDLSEKGAGDYVTNKLHNLTLKGNELNFVSPPDAGSYWDVFVTTTNEPDHFVVVPLLDICNLNTLIDKLHAEYEKTDTVVYTPNVGDLCAGLSTFDGYWYRIIILDTALLAGRMKVLFADYGNYDYIEPEMIRPLRDEYKRLPLQAVRAGLFDVEPAMDGKIWDPAAKRDFIQLCNEKKLVATIKSVDRNKNLLSQGPSVLFELHDTTGDTNINIDSELVRLGHARYKANL